MWFLNKLCTFKQLNLRSRFIFDVNLRLQYIHMQSGPKYLGPSTNIIVQCFHNERRLLRHSTFLFHPKRWCTSKILKNLNTIFDENEQNITTIFPEPRVTLNEFASRRPEKTFHIHYKQQSVSLKGAHKKAQKNNWICTYEFVWPEKIKFESTSLSKKQAAEKAATQSVEYLYKNNHMDTNGNPIYNESVLDSIKQTINKDIYAKVDENSVERFNRIWEEYNDGIKGIYMKTHEEMKLRNDNKLVEGILEETTLDDQEETSDSDRDEQPNNVINNEKKLRHPIYGRVWTTPSDGTMDRRQRRLTSALEESGEELMELPIDKYSSQITEALQTSRTVIIVGEAGCGKSTRVPRTLLEKYGAEANILVSEPRRVAAIGLAERVADELLENVGETVGYQVRLSSKLPSTPGGSILYATSGILLRRLLDNPGLLGCTHVIIDEAHERDINTDVILLLVKRALQINPQLKLVLMSATLNTRVFTNYFENCPVIEVPGRLFPVRVTYLEDLPQRYAGLDVHNTLQKCNSFRDRPILYCNEIVNLIKRIDRYEKEGAILVFLPGWAEIKNVKNMLEETFRNSSRHMIIPVHSRLTNTEQCKMYGRPPFGVRKIVISTNVAETSITIPDVVYVVDCGAHRETRLFKDTGNSSLECVWTSLSAAKQRAGRAGRIQPGHCFKMYTREIEKCFSSHNTPQILRVPLEQTALHCRTYAPEQSIEHFLSQLPEPPNERAIQYAIQELQDIGALTADQKLTRLGALLSTLTLSPRVGRMLVLASVMGSVVNMANVVTQISLTGEIFADAGDRAQEIREIKRGFEPTSDHVALHNILTEYEHVLNKGTNSAESYCRKYGLRQDRMNYYRALSSIYLSQLINMNIVDMATEVDDLNRFCDNAELTKLIILASCNKLLISREFLKTRGRLNIAKEITTSKGDKAHISMDSVNYMKRESPGADVSLYTYYGGFHSVERRALVLHCTSMVTPHIVLLSVQDDITKENIEDSDDVALKLKNHNIKIYMNSSEADVILKAREMLWNTISYYIERDVTKNHTESSSDTSEVYPEPPSDIPEENMEATTRFRIRLVKALCKLLNESAKDYYNIKE